jgi:hypothetical protein
MGWKIYFTFYFALAVYTYWISWGVDRNILEYLGILVETTSLIGVYGFAFKKKIGLLGFWRKGVFFIIFWHLMTLFLYHEPPQDNMKTLIVGIAYYSATLIFIPAYYALYSYGYKSESLWNPQPAPPK